MRRKEREQERAQEQKEERPGAGRLLLVGALTALVVGAGGVAYLYGPQLLSLFATLSPFGEQAPAAPAGGEVGVVGFLPADIAAPVTTSQTRRAFLTALAEQGGGQRRAGVVHIPIQHTHNGTARNATTQEILSLLAPRAPGSFTRSLDGGLMFGVHTGATTSPFLIIRAGGFETAFAGMLAWERHLMADFNPFFGAPVTRTFDRDARTINQTVPARFVDETVGNRSVRTLYNEFGEASLVYGFPTAQFIIITTTPEAYSALAGAL